MALASSVVTKIEHRSHKTDNLNFELSHIASIVAEIRRHGSLLWSASGDQATALQVFELMTHRDFCYLSKSRVEAYRNDVLSQIGAAIRCDAPILLYLDLGGGYHASIEPEGEELCFKPGLGELLVLLQAVRLSARVRAVYAPGIRFALVIDNLCALQVNDISVSQTEGYCANYRRMIATLELESWVDLLVESENFSPWQYPPMNAGLIANFTAVTPAEHGNIERFLGRACSADEAAERKARYSHFGACSERFLGSLITGVHLTQRASSTTLCFRAFPGSDCRIQAGQVAMQSIEGGGLKPFLLTSRNAHNWYCENIDVTAATGGALDTAIIARRAR